MPKVFYTDKRKKDKPGPVVTRKPGGKKFRTGSDPYIGLFPRTVEVGSKEDKQDQEGSAVGRAVRAVGQAVKDAVTYKPAPEPKNNTTSEPKEKPPTTKTVRFKKPGSSEFNKAFGAARKSGQSDFEFRGRKYTTNLKGEAPRATAPKTEGSPAPATENQPSLASRRPRPAMEDNTPPPMPSSSSFKQAFASARKAGESSFTWKGKTYNTKVK